MHQDPLLVSHCNVMSMVFADYLVGNYQDDVGNVNSCFPQWANALRWRHNGRYSYSNHRCLDCLLNRLFMRRSKKTLNLRTGLCVENSMVTGEFPSQSASNAENVSIWWRHHYVEEFPSHDDIMFAWIARPSTLHWSQNQNNRQARQRLSQLLHLIMITHEYSSSVILWDKA